MKNILASVLFSALCLFSCSDGEKIKRAAATITPGELREYTMTIGSDSMMGRKPFTEGETRSVTYLADCLAAIGFSPAFGESYFQEVPMVEVFSVVENPVLIKTNAGKDNNSFCT